MLLIGMFKKSKHTFLYSGTKRDHYNTQSAFQMWMFMHPREPMGYAYSTTEIQHHIEWKQLLHYSGLDVKLFFSSQYRWYIHIWMFWLPNTSTSEGQRKKRIESHGSLLFSIHSFSLKHRHTLIQPEHHALWQASYIIVPTAFCVFYETLMDISR